MGMAWKCDVCGATAGDSSGPGPLPEGWAALGFTDPERYASMGTHTFRDRADVCSPHCAYAWVSNRFKELVHVTHGGMAPSPDEREEEL